jgi:outer membrane protein assembly factor BamE (lipoprotein component of BamABCDE complex)
MITGTIRRISQMRFMRLLLAGIIAVTLLSCAKEEAHKARIWTDFEIKSLKGKTRDEVRTILGKPTGFYTMEAKGRWHYPGMLIAREGSSTPDTKSVIVYFSELGDHRCTIVDIMDRWEASKDKHR